MKEHDLPPLDEDLRALLRRASDFGGAPPETKARVIARVDSVIGQPIGRGGPGIPRSMRPLATLLLGGALGSGGVYGAMRPKEPTQRERLVYVERAVAATVPPTGAAIVASSFNPSPAVPAAAASTRSARSGVPRASLNSSAGTLSQLNAERTLLDAARGALEREDGAAALAALEQHERKFPSGVLVQEREAIAIRALMMLGRSSEAQARADRFRSRFPESALLPTIDSTVGESSGR